MQLGMLNDLTKNTIFHYSKRILYKTHMYCMTYKLIIRVQFCLLGYIVYCVSYGLIAWTTFCYKLTDYGRNSQLLDQSIEDDIGIILEDRP